MFDAREDEDTQAAGDGARRKACLRTYAMFMTRGVNADDARAQDMRDAPLR